jgi:phosphohistidine phosphatase SixA
VTALQPKCKTTELIRELRKHEVERLAIVGHEPSLSKLVAKLLVGHARSEAIQIDKGAAVILEFDRHIAEGKGRLVALVPPQWIEAIC